VRIGAAVVRRRSSFIYLSEAAENEIRQQLFRRSPARAKIAAISEAMALRIRSVSKKELNCGKRIIPSRNYEKGAIPQVSRDQPIELGIIRYSLQRPIALSNGIYAGHCIRQTERGAERSESRAVCDLSSRPRRSNL
jgi:hypothetical protein